MRPPTLRPAAELAANKPHGVRVRYMAGCRCVPCRAANARYETARLRARAKGRSNRIVSAERAVSHLRALSRAGVGRRRVARLSGLPESKLCKLLGGQQRNIREQTERRILAVTKADKAPGATVPAARTHRRIAALLEEGYTRARLAVMLGSRTPKLQLGRAWITRATEARIATLYRRAKGLDAEAP